jgi:D-amino-acid dehydrogenase
MRRVIVIGAGLAGITTAYELVRHGFATTLMERHAHVALGSSFANGALLTPSMADPWNAPGVHRQLLASFFDPHSAMKLRATAIPSLATWGVRFLRHSTHARHELATKANFRLAGYSLRQLEKLCAGLALEFDAAAVGTLKLFRTQAAMERPLALARMLAPLGLRSEVLSADQAIDIEPTLDGIRSRIAGVIRFPDDRSGDARRFCEQLAVAFLREGGIMRLNAEVSGIAHANSTVLGVRLGDALEPADCVVVAAGNASAQLAGSLGISLPIRPAKGYTLTFDTSQISRRPLVPVIDETLHAAVVPIGFRMRIAGTAEFAGTDLRIRPERIENLHHLLSAIFPRIAEQLPLSGAETWAGLRPMSADGLPFIGPTRVKGLHVNAGHGHLGWTLAVGSACLLADLMQGNTPQIDASPYRIGR